MNPEIIDQFKNKKILVIGDIILDKYIWGNVTRISPEAPIPIVEVDYENHVPGGAANTAHNIAALGGKVFLHGVVGKDYCQQMLFTFLKQCHVETTHIVIDKKRPTTHKTRVIAQSQQLVRIDYENRNLVDASITAQMIKNIKKIIPQADAVVVSDYAKGVITEELMHALIEQCGLHSKKIIIDPKPQHAAWYSRAFIITPNYKEAIEMAQAYGVSSEDVSGLGSHLISHLQSNILITQGKDGMTLFEKNAPPLHIPTTAQEVYDVSGAGDTVVAALALGLSCGCCLKDAATIANSAAGIVVGKMGTAVVTPHELKKTIV